MCHCKQLIPPFAKTASFYNSFLVSSASCGRASLITGMEYGMEGGMENGMEW